MVFVSLSLLLVIIIIIIIIIIETIFGFSVEVVDFRMGIGFIIQHFLDRSNAWKTNSNNGLIEKKGPGFLFFFLLNFRFQF